MPCYRFTDFVVSPRRRILLRDGHELPLIPRYFDLLVFLIQHRNEAVHRRDIFDKVWTDVIVSDSALSQAVRTIRQTLGDDSREPRFIRTVSRHGYRFVFADVIEEAEEDAPALVEGTGPARTAAPRWAGAATGGGLAGVIAGGLGGLILAATPGSVSPLSVAPVLAVVGGACGAIGGAGVGAGLSIADAVAGSRTRFALLVGAAVGGATVGLLVQSLARWTLVALVGVTVSVGGWLEGLVLGAAAGLGYALVAPAADGGPAAARGVRPALLTAALCGVGALALTLTGHPLVGGTIHAIARAAHGSQVTLAPLGRLIGEPDFGPITQAIIGFGEGAIFGAGIMAGLMRRQLR